METKFLDNIPHTPISLSKIIINGFTPYFNFFSKK